ncbi:ProQ/FINO family protein [Kushneria indalinina]|uniref:ProP effector n=1 Tax=Kushneria indalinina DSM 14324 TaxID=1122140 RepID=A0A3D9DUB7_9GAMM|nr:ProQ/FINO family protein [Kushneria indalinina]REC94342.1 ProP effector [Kushneria indalinina DSM 14324]
MSDRFDEVFRALEKQASDLTARLESARTRIRELEATNRQLTARLTRIQQMSGAEGERSPVQPAPADIPSESVSMAFDGAEAGNMESTDNNDASRLPVSEVPAEPDALPPTPDESSTPTEQNMSEVVEAAPIDPAQEDISPQALLKQWYRRYPKTFFERHTRPLAIGIHEALAAREPYSEKLIRRALAGYVNLPRYLKSVRVNAARIDLEGQEAGRVEEEDARHAQEQLKRLQDRQQEREAEKQKRRLAQKMSELAHRHQR